MEAAAAGLGSLPSDNESENGDMDAKTDAHLLLLRAAWLMLPS